MKKLSLEPILSEHPFFRDLAPEYLNIIVGCASNTRFSAGEYLCRENENADQFYLIREGRVSVRIPAPPRGSIVIETLDEGDVLGWSWLFPPYRWRFNAVASQMTRAIALDGKCLRGKCEKNHDLGYELMKRFAQIMTSRLESTRLQLLDVYGDVGVK